MTIQQQLAYVLEHKASDLHLVPEYPPLVRIDGVLLPIAGHKEWQERFNARRIGARAED